MALYRAEKDKQNALRALGEHLAAMQREAQATESEEPSDEGDDPESDAPIIEVKDAPPPTGKNESAPRSPAQILAPSELPTIAAATSSDVARLVKLGFCVAAVNLGIMAVAFGVWRASQRRTRESQDR